VKIEIDGPWTPPRHRAFSITPEGAEALKMLAEKEARIRNFWKSEQRR
jgi:hypothetical protein